MSITRRVLLSCVAAGWLIVPAGADNASKEPLTPEQAWHLQDGATATVRFEIGKGFAVSDDGEVWLLHVLSGDPFTAAEPFTAPQIVSLFSFRVIMTEGCRKEFARIGVAKLADHFRGRVVTVRGKVSTVPPEAGGDTGGMPRKRISMTRVTLTIDTLDQLVSVR
jgi:hypothetical protein